MQPLRVQLVALQGGLHMRHQSWLAQLVGGQLHRHCQPQALCLPLAKLLAGLLDDPGAQRADQTKALGHRDELRRPDHAAQWVAPAQQDLDASASRETAMAASQDSGVSTGW